MVFPVFSKGRRGLRTALLRGAVAVLALVISAAVLSDRLADLEVPAVSSALASIPLTAWLMACAASAVSFLAVGQYDALFHGWLGTGIGPRRAARSGAASIAVAQFLGFGLVTGTLARWRSLPELSLPVALKITHYVSFSFLAVLGTLAALAACLSGSEMPGTGLVAGLAIAVTLSAAVLSMLPQGWLPVAIPPLRVQVQLFVLAALDTGFAALALWSLLPPDIAPGVLQLFAAFLVSLMAGFISGTPGGLGPFEVLLIALLPQVPEPELLASILAFRLVYHALPACLALLLLARPGPPWATPRPRPDEPTTTRRAEAGLAHLPGHRLDRLDRLSAVTADAGSSLVAIGDPVCGEALAPGDLEALTRMAHDRGFWPALYKIGARSAATARRQGWRVAAIAEEASIDTHGFSAAGPERRQLRRKLRKADLSGVTITSPDALPFAEMAPVADEWTRRSGGERGFSMGVFTRRYVERQRVFLARQNGRLVAFATFHATAEEWTLDLMRSADAAPNGVMHALIMEAIVVAAREGVPRLSLAAMPLSAASGAVALLSRRPEAAGQRRFKQSFAPRADPLYLAAPNVISLAVAAVGILASIWLPHGARNRTVGAFRWIRRKTDRSAEGMRQEQRCDAALNLVGR